MDLFQYCIRLSFVISTISFSLEVSASTNQHTSSFVSFESGQVRPLALSTDGKTLFAVNTPDNRLEVFKVGKKLKHLGSISVGLEPVSVAVKNNREVWVVNHISDSVSIVELNNNFQIQESNKSSKKKKSSRKASKKSSKKSKSSRKSSKKSSKKSKSSRKSSKKRSKKSKSSRKSSKKSSKKSKSSTKSSTNQPAPMEPSHIGRVVKTLLVGDEPRDIVFAGRNNNRAFITTAHRGQNAPFDPQLTTPGIGRADVWVFNTNKTNKKAGTNPLSIITLFGDTPRALAVSPDRSKVYAAVFHSGNQTTTLFEEVVSQAMGLPDPLTNFESQPQPSTGLIVKFERNHWLDNIGRNWSQHVRFSLPDKDVFVIDANANPPKQVSGKKGFFSGVGTVIFNMIVNPKNGNVYVTNTEANNLTRFEGPGDFSGTSIRGQVHENRITVLRKNGSVNARHLNKHIDYNFCCAAIPNNENSRSLALPMGMAITKKGKTLYVAAFGSNKIAVFDTQSLENDTFQPSQNNQITITGGGPSGIVLDEKHHRLYVLTRFDNSISVIDTTINQEIDHIPMYNPEPDSIIAGRPFLYDASFTSSHGDTACASCHVFGDLDSLAWDLGDPDLKEINNPGPFTLRPEQTGFTTSVHFRPLKGPMTTQSLRGMANHGPMHWRGDRTAGNDEQSSQPDKGAFNEDLAFKKFNVAFASINGRHAPLTNHDMQAFTDFVLQMTYPPNPIRALDNSLTASQTAGRDFYFGEKSDSFFNCNGCHLLDPDGNKNYGVAKPGFFGTEGKYSFEFENQIFKIPHLRNLYQKVGMFGQKVLPFNSAALPPFFLPKPLNNNAFMGNQIRGFGFLHDGSTDTIFRFHGSIAFVHRPDNSPSPNPGGFTADIDGFIKRRQVEQFLLAYDSNLAPIVGQQVTLNKYNSRHVTPRINLLIERSEANECDLVAKTIINQREAGFLYLREGDFKSDIKHDSSISDNSLRQYANVADGEITYTCVPKGSGVRIALDRDEDGIWNGDQ